MRIDAGIRNNRMCSPIELLFCDLVDFLPLYGYRLAGASDQGAASGKTIQSMDHDADHLLRGQLSHSPSTERVSFHFRSQCFCCLCRYSLLLEKHSLPSVNLVLNPIV